MSFPLFDLVRFFAQNVEKKKSAEIGVKEAGGRIIRYWYVCLELSTREGTLWPPGPRGKSLLFSGDPYKKSEISYAIGRNPFEK